ncbi:hypothetical protein HY570_03065 [Candidatus Micrarchaeota archaeon]|nr:hypothetical protein [Candidatus Micrarchaeota archaeon]
MLKVKKLSLDVVKPTELRTSSLLEVLSQAKAKINRVQIDSYELERNTESLKIIIEGDSLDMDEVYALIKQYGGVVQNLDMVIAEKG